MHFYRAIAAAVFMSLFSTGAIAAPIQLRSGEISPRLDKAGMESLSGYVLLQFDAVPEEAMEGITLLRYIPQLAWWAKVEAGALGNKKSTGPSLTFAAPAESIDKIAPELRAAAGGEKQGLIEVLVLLLPGAAREEANAALTAMGASAIWRLEGLAQVRCPAAALDALNAVPGVEWVSSVPGPDKPDNVVSQQRIRADIIQEAPLLLDGAGVTFGVWEANGVPYLHEDFTDNLTVVDADVPVSDHATHVTGTLIGTGAGSANARGFATGATVRAFSADADIPEMYSNALAGLTQLSNHSYGTRTGWDNSDGPWVDRGAELFGAYSAFSYFWDDVVTGTGLVIFKSAGNDRNEGPDGAAGPRRDGPYDTIEHRAAAKNLITIGALNDNDTMSSFSSWGPVDDGRVKPDLCANGVGLRSTLPGNAYDNMSGTSMATPSACGAGGLLYQHYRNIHNADPAAATLKALMIHAADDLGRPGPDYEFGWGIIDAEESAELISEGLFREGTATTTTVVRYTVQVPENLDTLKATLVWTDVPGSPSAQVALVNDLDLALVDPDGNVYFPWVLDKNTPDADATTGRNSVDNVEQVVVPSPVAGEWTLRVTGFLVPSGPASFTVVSEAFGDFLDEETEGGSDEGEGAFEAEGESEEGEGLDGGCAPAPLVVDFCKAFNDVRNNTLLQGLDAAFQPLIQKLDPAVADINGIFAVDLSNLNNPLIQMEGNGILDVANELALLQQILADECFDNGRVTHAQVRAAWKANETQLLQKQIGPLATLLKSLIKGLDQILIAYTVIGDGQLISTGQDSAAGYGSFGIVAGLFHVLDGQIRAELGQGFLDSTLDPNDFISIPALRPDRNADLDAYSNMQEYEYYQKRACSAKNGMVDYPLAALRSDIFPGSEIGEGEGEGNEGEGQLEGEGAEEGGQLEGEGEGLIEGEGEGQLEGEGQGDGEGSEGEGEQVYHTADLNQSGDISLRELLRAVQFYNADGFHCAAEPGEEDPYEPGPGDCSACAPHSGDYEEDSPCRLSLSELLRLIQLFNVRSYIPCESPDGFCAVS